MLFLPLLTRLRAATLLQQVPCLVRSDVAAERLPILDAEQTPALNEGRAGRSLRALLPRLLKMGQDGSVDVNELCFDLLHHFLRLLGDRGLAVT